MRHTSLPITPIYITSQPNESFTLYDGLLVVQQDEKRVECSATIRFEWLPNPRITFNAYQEGTHEQPPSLMALDFGSALVKLPEAQEPASMHILGDTRTISDTLSISVPGSFSDIITFDSGEPLQYVIFHVVNFEEFFDFGALKQAKEEGKERILGRAIADFDGWRLTLDNLDHAGDFYRCLNAQRGYGITHVARLERIDEASFTVAQVKHVLKGLHWFLSFTRGLWAPSILPMGFDNSGRCAWQEWSGGKATPYRYAKNWFSDMSHVSRNMQEGLSGFWRKWNDPIWNDPASNNTPLILAIHWFVTANLNEAALEGSIILAQTGLELLSWVYLVEDHKTHSAQQFDGGRDGNGVKHPRLSAAEKFEALLHHIGADLSIPTELTELRALALTKGWTNGPEAIAGYRNTIVHPARRAENSDVASTEAYSVLQLALWYIEISLLHIFEYQGEYVNRITAQRSGQTDLVPWIPPSSP